MSSPCFGSGLIWAGEVSNAWSWVCVRGREEREQCHVVCKCSRKYSSLVWEFPSHIWSIHNRARVNPFLHLSPLGAEYADKNIKGSGEEKREKIFKQMKTSKQMGWKSHFHIGMGESVLHVKFSMLMEVCNQGDKNRFLRFPCNASSECRPANTHQVSCVL